MDRLKQLAVAFYRLANAVLRAVMRWLLQVLIALDQLVNAIIGGWADETLSSYAYRMEREGKLAGRLFRGLIDTLFYPIQKDHCRKAFMAEVTRIHTPPSLRK